MSRDLKPPSRSAPRPAWIRASKEGSAALGSGLPGRAAGLPRLVEGGQVPLRAPGPVGVSRAQDPFRLDESRLGLRIPPETRQTPSIAVEGSAQNRIAGRQGAPR